MFSFQGSKVMVAGEGGMLLCDAPVYFERAAALGHYERLNDLPEESPYRRFALTGLGFKHRMHPLGAAIALRDLEELDERNEIRYQNGRMLDSLLSDLPFLSFQRVLPDAKRLYAYHYARYHAEALGGVSLPTVLRVLKAEGLTVGLCGYGHLHEAPLFTEGSPYGEGCPCIRAGAQKGGGVRTGELPVTRLLAESTFFLAPRFENSCRELVEGYSKAYHKLLGNLDALLELDKASSGQERPRAKTGASINLV